MALEKPFEMDIEYKRPADWGAQFVVPEAHIQNSHLTFDKADSFGFKLAIQRDVSYGNNVIGITHGPDERLEEFDIQYHENDTCSIKMGLDIKLPKGTCFMVLGLLPCIQNYVIDANGEPNSFKQIRLYLTKQGNDSIKIENGTPVLWILPIPDMAYSYQYRRKATGKSGDK